MNISYDPEGFGVKQIDQFDLSSGAYEFDYVTVWQSLTDKRTFYIGSDSGCSCPSPYDDVLNLEDLERLDPDNPRPQIESMFRLDTTNYSHSTADLLKGISDMVALVKEAQQ